ncbi:cyclin D6;1 [Carex rostrata]
MEFDLENPFTCSDEEESPSEMYGTATSASVESLFAAESDHSPAAGDNSVRRSAVSFIFQAQFSCGFDQHIAYLAINYVDRFLSKREIPREKQPWVVQLLAIACLSLASKMKRSDLSLTDLQKEEGIIFDSSTIHRMELLVLSTLDWRMRSITPFSFLRFFLSFFSSNQPAILLPLKSRASQILFGAQNETSLLEFKPSLISGAALLSAAHELFPAHFPDFESAISACKYVNEERLWECCAVMAEIADGESALCDVAAESIADTPVTVLAGHIYTSSESEQTVGSSSDGLDRKKRRISASPYYVSVPQSKDPYYR